MAWEMADDVFPRLPPDLPIETVLNAARQIRCIRVSLLTEEQVDLVIRSFPHRNKNDPFIQASVAANGTWTKRNKPSSRTVDFAYAYQVQEACFPVQPEYPRIYKKFGSVTPFVWLEGFASSFDEADGVDPKELHLFDTTLGSVEGEDVVRPRDPAFPHSHRFVSISVAAQACPAARQQLVQALGFADAPEIPTYSVQKDGSGDASLPGRWVTSLDLEAAMTRLGFDVDGDEDEESSFTTVLHEKYGVNKNKHVRNAVRSDDGTFLISCKSTKGGSAPIVSISALRAQLRRVGELLAPALPGAPIFLATNPAARKASSIPAGARICSVEMTISRRLRAEVKDTFLSELSAVTRMERAMCEYGTLFLNIHLMRLLRDGGGVLSDGNGPDAFNIEPLMRKCMCAVRFGRPKHPSLSITYDEFKSTLDRFVDESLPDTGNCVKYAATQLTANIYNSIAAAGAKRTHALLTAARKLHGGGVDMVDQAHAYVQHQRSDLGDCTLQVADLARKYRSIYAEKGLASYPGFDLNSIGKARRPQLARRCLEVLHEINVDLRNVKEAAIASGRWRSPTSYTYDDEEKTRVWKSYEFSLLSVSSLTDRCSLIDKDVFARKCFSASRQLTEDLQHVFKTDKQARSQEKGWKRSSIFRTNGTKLIEIWYLEKPSSGDQGRPPPSKPKNPAKNGPRNPSDFVDVPPGARKVGDDPGDVNEHTVCEVLPNGTAICRFLTRDNRKRVTAPIRKRRETRQRLFAATAVDDLSSTRKKTACLETFVEYADARGRWRASLTRAFACRAARADAFEEGRRITKRLDKFINLVIDGGADGREFRKNIAGDPTKKLKWGEGNRTRSAKLARRLNSAFQATVDHMWIEEAGTTKFDAITGNELDDAWRQITLKGGKKKWVTDRDVKFRKPEDVLGSHHPFPISADLLKGKGFRDIDLETRHAVCRDGNASYAIRGRIGVPPEEWPTPTGLRQRT